ncbi:MAG: hypothetical protein RI928_472 [Pseudomonadota bacterium]|jgi:uncharacterized iron-regulated protein
MNLAKLKTKIFLKACLVSVFFCQGPAAAVILDLSSGKEISEPLLAERLRSADIVLLGELHDNPFHHQARATFIPRFAHGETTVVAEHLPAGHRVTSTGEADRDLEAAGFNRKGWGWPLHQPLFESVLGRGYALVGGNLPAGFSKELMAQGQAAMALSMAKSYEQSTLPDLARAQLEQDLVDGHCGQLPEKYLASMKLVQRATDISMATALLANRPAVLVAGNGHVRRDYGVPQVLAALDPSLKISSVGFYENGTDRAELIKSLAGRYDFVWLTDRAQRSDPCEDFKIK